MLSGAFLCEPSRQLLRRLFCSHVVQSKQRRKEVKRLAISKAKKQELVESYIKQLDRSPAIMLVEYRGMTVQQL